MVHTELGAREQPEVYCEICSTLMFEKHCKIICPNCGFKWDCSDH